MKDICKRHVVVKENNSFTLKITLMLKNNVSFAQSYLISNDAFNEIEGTMFQLKSTHDITNVN